MSSNGVGWAVGILGRGWDQQQDSILTLYWGRGMIKVEDHCCTLQLLGSTEEAQYGHQMLESACGQDYVFSRHHLELVHHSPFPPQGGHIKNR